MNSCIYSFFQIPRSREYLQLFLYLIDSTIFRVSKHQTLHLITGAYAQSNGNKTERILPGSRGSRPVQVISETAVLESGIPTSGKDQPIVICRQEPLMRPNVKVLSKLHRLPHGHLR